MKPTPPRSTRAELVNITLVSGFLGAGKTTLLRQLIVHALRRGERVVVVENEFGSVGLDAALLAQSGVPVHELNQGCLCCTLRADFVTTLESLLDVPHPPDRLFFEPSGIFVPDTVLELLGSPEFRDRCRLEVFITVVDAQRFRRSNAMAQNFLRRQARFADHLAISKAENLGDADRAALVADLVDFNPAVPRFVPREGMLAEELELYFSGAEGARPHPSRFRAPRDAGHGIEIVTLEFPSSTTETTLRAFLGGMDNPEGSVLRVKGRGVVDGRWCDVSWVGGEAELRPTPEGSEQIGQLIVIGCGLDESRLRSAWVGA